MKNCTEVRKLISLYIDNELSKAELEEFNKHINSCSHCRTELEEIKTVVRFCSDIDEVELPANFKSELHEKLVEIKNQMDKRNRIVLLRNKYIKIFSTVAAGFLLVLFVKGFYDRGAFGPFIANDSAKSEEAVEAPMEIMSDAAEENFEISAAGNKSKEKFESAEQDAEISMMAPEKESAGSARYTKGSDGRKTGTAIVDMGLVTNRKVNIAISVDNTVSIEEETEKIRGFALQNGAEFPKLNMPEAADTFGIKEQPQEESDEQSIIILNFKIPNIYYEQLVSQLTSEWGKEEVVLGDVKIEDLTSTIDQLNIIISDLNEQISKVESRGEVSDLQELERLKDEREKVLDEIESINLDSDFTFVNIEVKKNDETEN
jgi:hypothetical protein